MTRRVRSEVARPNAALHTPPVARRDTGRRIGRWRVLEELARGGQGAVYAVEAEEADGPRTRGALKVLLDRADDAAARFAREARALARLAHPNLVRVLDVGEGPSGPYFVMERVDGTDLRDRVKAQGPPDPDEAARLLAAVADCVAYLHEAGVVHRDLKPANVVLEAATGRPVVVDLGLVRRDRDRLASSMIDRASLTVTGEVLGTPEYMAPEQVDPGFGPIGPAADVYALGGLLHFLLTGAPPHRGASVYDTLRGILVDPRALAPGAPRGLAALCRRALAKEAGARPASARAFGAGLAATAHRGPRAGAAVALVVATGLGAAGAIVALDVGAPARAPAAAAPTPPAATGEAAPVDATRTAAATGAEEEPTPARAADEPTDAAGDLVDRARDRLAADDAHAAEALATRALVHDPDHVDARLVRGLARLTRDRVAEAEVDLRAAAERDPRDHRAWAYLAQAHVSAGRLREAVEAATRSLELEPSADAYSQRALAHVGLGDRAAALDDFEVAIDLAPEWDMLYANRATARFDFGDPEGARADAERAIELAGPRAPLLVTRAKALHALGRLAEGARTIDRALELEPDRVSALVVRGLFRLSAGDAQGALADADRALRVKPGDPAGLRLRVDARTRLGDWEGVAADAQRLLARDPDDPARLTQRGRARLQLGELDGALADLDRAIELAPSAGRHHYRGDARAGGADWEGAITDYRRALELDPERLAERENLAICWLELGDAAAARAELEALIARAPTARRHALLANVLRQLGEIAAAEAALEQGHALDPTDHAPLAIRAQLRADQGDREGSLADIERALARRPPPALAESLRELRRELEEAAPAPDAPGSSR